MIATLEAESPPPLPFDELPLTSEWFKDIWFLAKTPPPSDKLPKVLLPETVLWSSVTLVA